MNVTNRSRARKKNKIVGLGFIAVTLIGVRFAYNFLNVRYLAIVGYCAAGQPKKIN